MGQPNMSYTGPMPDGEPQLVNQRPEPYMVSYGGGVGLAQPFNSNSNSNNNNDNNNNNSDNNNNNQTMLPPPGNITASDPRYLPENSGQLTYGNGQYSGERNTLMMPSPSTGVVPVPVSRDHVPFSNTLPRFEGYRGLVRDESTGLYKVSGSSGVPFEGNRGPGPMGAEFDAMVERNARRLARDRQMVQAVPPGGFPWINHAQGLPYQQDMGHHGSQVAGMSRNPPSFIPLVGPLQGRHNVYHPQVLPLPPPPQPPTMLPMQAQNMDIHLQLPSPPHRPRSTRISSTNPFQNETEPVPSFVGPAPPHGVMVNEASRHQLTIDSIVRQRMFHELRNLHEDAMLALSQLVANIDSGMSDVYISEHLQTRTFSSEDIMPADEEHNFCVICQMEFEDQEKIGTLECRHEYHAECIKKWLVVRNTCPICKSRALQ